MAPRPVLFVVAPLEKEGANKSKTGRFQGGDAKHTMGVVGLPDCLAHPAPLDEGPGLVQPNRPSSCLAESGPGPMSCGWGVSVNPLDARDSRRWHAPGAVSVPPLLPLLGVLGQPSAAVTRVRVGGGK